MNRRERVIAAIEHCEPDHVPCNFHAVPLVWDRMMDHYGYTDRDEFYNFLNNHIIKVGDDFNRDPKRMNQDIHNHRDVFGCVWDISHGDMGHPKSFPLMDQKIPTLKGFDWPDPFDYWDFDEMEQTVKKWRGEVFILGKIGECLFERSWIVRGMEQLFMDLIDHPDSMSSPAR